MLPLISKLNFEEQKVVPYEPMSVTNQSQAAPLNPEQMKEYLKSQRKIIKHTIQT